jgi:hypothetical protein
MKSIQKSGKKAKAEKSSKSQKKITCQVTDVGVRQFRPLWHP